MMHRTQPAVAELLSVIQRRWDPAREGTPYDRLISIQEAAEKVRQAQADDEYASWLEVPRCDAS